MSSAILGGSLGAAVLNDQAARIASDADPDELSLLHLAGPDHAPGVRTASERSVVRWVVEPYEAEMEWFYAAVDAVLARSGALTISELAVTGTPAILVPLEATHQDANAAVLRAAGAAVVVRQEHVDRIPVEAQQLIKDGARRSAMAEAAATVAAPDAAGAVAEALLEAAGA